MNDDIPRLRMFAGPNGSGKTTIKNSLQKSNDWFGLYINPDDLEKAIRSTGGLDLRPLAIILQPGELQDHFAASPLLRMHGMNGDASRIRFRCNGDWIDFSGLVFNSYHASALSDLFRQKALQKRRSFSFETVMSSPDKIQLLRDANAELYRTYLYFVATEDPAINVQRVKLRFAQGGHDVPEQKVVERYFRSLSLLKDAVLVVNRAFFFDASGDEAVYFAETTDGSAISLKSTYIPRWFEPIWSLF